MSISLFLGERIQAACTAEKPDREFVVAVLSNAYRNALNSSSTTAIEIGWTASFRDDFGRLGSRPPSGGSTDPALERVHEKGTTWVRMSGDWRRDSSSVTKMLGPADFKIHVTMAGGDFVIDSRTKRADMVTLQLQTDDRMGKRGLSPTTVMSTGFVARIILSELNPSSKFRFERKNGFLCVRSEVPEDLDVDIDEQSGAILRVATHMSPEVLLRARYSGSLGTPVYPVPQPEEMLLEVESRTDSQAMTCSRFKFSRVSFVELAADRFHWSDVAPLAHWQGSDSVIKKDGSIDEAASARFVTHNAEVAKPVPQQFRYSPNGPPALIDRTGSGQGWFFATGALLLVSAGIIVIRRQKSLPAA